MYILGLDQIGHCDQMRRIGSDWLKSQLVRFVCQGLYEYEFNTKC